MVVYSSYKKLLKFRKNLDDAVLVDQEMQSRLDRVMALASSEGVAGYQLSPSVYVLRDQVSTLSPLGWVHVYKSDIGKIECSLR